jgi:hypothetical protein
LLGLPPLHSITSSARSRNDSGIVDPRAFAVLRLIASSYFHRPLHRQIGGTGALQNLMYVRGCAPKQVGQACAVGHEASGNHILPQHVHPRQPVLRQELDYPTDMELMKGVSTHRVCIGPLPHLSQPVQEISAIAGMRGGPGRSGTLTRDQRLTERCGRLGCFEAKRLFSLVPAPRPYNRLSAPPAHAASTLSSHCLPAAVRKPAAERG